MSMVHRFCIMVRAVVSSQSHIIFMPPVTFSNLKVQRGVIIHVAAVGMLPTGAEEVVIPGRSIIAFISWLLGNGKLETTCRSG
jgi:hypothetical protein